MADISRKMRPQFPQKSDTIGSNHEPVKAWLFFRPNYFVKFRSRWHLSYWSGPLPRAYHWGGGGGGGQGGGRGQGGEGGGGQELEGRQFLVAMKKNRKPCPARAGVFDCDTGFDNDPKHDSRTRFSYCNPEISALSGSHTDVIELKKL